MKKFQHLNRIKKKKLTFMIIPNSTGKIMEFTIPSWIPLFTLSCIIITLIVTAISSSTLLSTQKQLHVARANVMVLEEENMRQASEITFLTQRSAEIEKQLFSLNELKKHVLDIVGLDTQETSNKLEEPFFLVSRSYQRSPSYIEEYEEDMEYLEILIEKQKETMSQLVDDVEKQLDYLDALPNLQPAIGRITSGFGYRISPINRRREFHSGIDIANVHNTDILAAGSGVVTYSGYNGSYGRMVIVSHGNGYVSVYAHNRENLVSVGQHVKEGDVIAKMGSTGRSTGPHVHFEVRKHGEPIDPMELLKD
ncbi:Murein DD-endopeptidase MepM and murein hydrolase activator NlpD, contain LysM domain [Natronincola peptidivorans]|uniref:Murein DD-endopeptidase MepM and murein hydrolase activator NlpD, contain LysM domain n=1 Tax=Natronincola peptidivorans TaxID=426128 RepID=A0A1I0GGN2_9FIRM|nr:M23 family metallopeptidase [Natronincola peptidivorans]SET69466.1 Murein DD-endopeptidase MepM and murein hydrolase activator NlpD, contain LysM domain [Natronincola peptidivorans]